MKLIVLFFALISLNTFAGDDDHPMSKFVGSDVDLHVEGHTFAGKVADKLIFVNVSENGHQESTVTLKNHHEIQNILFANRNGVWGGVIPTKNGDKEISLARIDQSIPAYYILVDGQEYKVRVESDGYANNHFENPTYILEKDGKDFPLKLLKGKACWMYSLHIILTVFGTFLI